MQNFSQEYIGALALVLISILKIFNLEIPSDAITGIITGGIAIYIAFRRLKKGDITLLGRKV